MRSLDLFNTELSPLKVLAGAEIPGGGGTVKCVCVCGGGGGGGGVRMGWGRGDGEECTFTLHCHH